MATRKGIMVSGVMIQALGFRVLGFGLCVLRCMVLGVSVGSQGLGFHGSPPPQSATTPTTGAACAANARVTTGRLARPERRV